MKKRIVLALAMALIIPMAMTGCKKKADKAADDQADAVAAACKDPACAEAGKCSHAEAAKAALKDAHDHPKGEHPKGEHPK